MLRTPRDSTRLLLMAGAATLLTVLAGCHKRTPAGLGVPVPTESAAPTPPPPPPVPGCTLTAEPATINQGSAATLSWTSTNATDVGIEPGLGKQQAFGSASVSPEDSTSYVLTASGPGGSTTCTARLTVAVPPSTVPALPPAANVSEENLFVSTVKDVYFDFDKADLRSDMMPVLKADGEFLRLHPEIKLTLQGNCDERGSEEYNLGLGDRRAQAVKAYLVDSGVDTGRVSAVSFGKDRPVCTDHTEECWQMNRRAHFALGNPQPPQ